MASERQRMASCDAETGAARHEQCGEHADRQDYSSPRHSLCSLHSRHTSHLLPLYEPPCARTGYSRGSACTLHARHQRERPCRCTSYLCEVHPAQQICRSRQAYNLCRTSHWIGASVWCQVWASRRPYRVIAHAIRHRSPYLRLCTCCSPTIQRSRQGKRPA
jgi:hypothetical protein